MIARIASQAIVIAQIAKLRELATLGRRASIAL